jgi:hypothetical protein
LIFGECFLKNENVLRHEVSFEKYKFISLVTKEGVGGLWLPKVLKNMI